MKITKVSIGNPIAVYVGILLVALFGLVSLFNLPLQLIPEIQEPQITISTSWRAAAPNEVEAEIIELQEDVLRGLPGMSELESKAMEGRAEIILTFSIDVDYDRALIEVMNRLNQVPRYPDDADEPVISTVGADEQAIAWFTVRKLPGNEQDISGYKTFMQDVVQTRFERVPGIARSTIYGARDSEVRITFDPYKVASLGIQLPVVSTLAGGGEDVSGGGIDVGKREYSLRYAGKYDVKELGSLIIEWRDGLPVYLSDVATVERKLVDKVGFVMSKDGISLAVNAQRDAGVNVLQVMEGLREATAELKDGPLQRAGLEIEQVYDETNYIDSSILMLRNNLFLGIFLATIILWWFLRKLRATIIIAIAIPICLLSSFLTLYITGRTLNVISLAGLAFAVGMVMDSSIVVLENIVRLRERGKSIKDAAVQGADSIWGALLASTATTVAIFLPIIFLKGEVGQIFGDLALAIAATVCFSLIVAISIVPTFAYLFLQKAELSDPHESWWKKTSDFIIKLTDTPRRRIAWIFILLTIPTTIAYSLLPTPDYLPEGNRKLIFAFLLPPPGSSVEHLENELGHIISDRFRPYIYGEKTPKIEHYFFVTFSGGVFLGVRVEDRKNVDGFINILNEVISEQPDVLGFVNRQSIFGNSNEGRTIDMDIQARDLATALNAARVAFINIPGAIPGSIIQPLPGLELANPELRLLPNERRIAEAGWNRATMASITRALGDGLYVGDYFDGDKTIDIIVRSEPWETPEEFASIPVATPRAGVLPISELVEVTRTSGPEQIRRINRRRTVTLRIKPPQEVSLSQTIEILKSEVEPKIRPMLPEDGDIVYSGAADKLESALTSIQGSFLLAIAILYLLMSALFRSFRDSLMVLFTIPLATVGGVLMLKLINTVPTLILSKPFFQQMDMLTMIGFIILLGLVVNNAILLVYQARIGEREGLPRAKAVERAVNLRLRPILMSTLTSIFGMLPLLLVPGAGTELYRGLAGVIVGGMSVSTIFTLILLPSLLRVGEGKPSPAPA